MAANDDDTLERLSALKERAKVLSAKLEEAKVRRAVLQDRMATLDEKLRKALGHADWSKARETLNKLNQSADDAIEALAAALDGVDF